MFISNSVSHQFPQEEVISYCVASLCILSNSWWSYLVSRR